MLRIRLRRVGRKNEPHYQVVVAPRTNAVKGNYTAKLGWYNPKTKEFKVDKNQVLEWLNKGALPSNSVAKLLLNSGIKHKLIVYVKDAPGKPKKSDKSEKNTSTPQNESGNSESQPESAKKVNSEKAPGTEEKAAEVTTEKVPPKDDKVVEEDKTKATEDKEESKSDK